MNDDLLQAVRDFLDAFENVFDKDWNYTKEMLGVRGETAEQAEAARKMGLETIPIVSKNGTFLCPGVEDETSDWGNRGALLERYRTLNRLLQR